MSGSFFVMLCQCSVTVIMCLQQCVAINVFVTVLLAFGETRRVPV